MISFATRNVQPRLLTPCFIDYLVVLHTRLNEAQKTALFACLLRNTHPCWWVPSAWDCFAGLWPSFLPSGNWASGKIIFYALGYPIYKKRKNWKKKKFSVWSSKLTDKSRLTREKLTNCIWCCKFSMALWEGSLMKKTIKAAASLWGFYAIWTRGDTFIEK